METLNDILKSFSNNKVQWLYYNSKELGLDDILSNPDKALDFIKSYFDIGGKSSAFDDLNNFQHKNQLLSRSVHIVSTFFLGLKIAKCFGIDLESRDEDNMSFIYYWFLTCLYHDIGYVYEANSTCEHLRMLSVDGLEAVQEICNIKYLHNRVFKTYSRDMVDLYLKGRSTCKYGKKGVLDHGIIGGLLLYDRLRKQFEKSWKKRINKNDSRKSFYIYKNENHLHLSNSHYEAYANAADAIIAHNIWTNTLNEYLVASGQPERRFPPISFENKLCFILCLADTVEPLKRNINYADKIFFSFEDNQICGSTEEEIYKTVYGNIKALECWMDVRVNNDNSSFTIRLNTSNEE